MELVEKEHEMDVDGCQHRAGMMDLPDEMLLHTIGFVFGAHVLIRLGSTCKRVHGMVDDEDMWRKRCLGLCSLYEHRPQTFSWRRFYCACTTTYRLGADADVRAVEAHVVFDNGLHYVGQLVGGMPHGHGFLFKHRTVPDARTSSGGDDDGDQRAPTIVPLLSQTAHDALFDVWQQQQEQQQQQQQRPLPWWMSTWPHAQKTPDGFASWLLCDFVHTQFPVATMAAGDWIKGRWAAGVPHEAAVSVHNTDKTIHYRGTVIAGKAMGRGVWTDGEGIYEGALVDGKRHGFGTLLFPNGVTKYKGRFLDGKCHGHGTLWQSDGSCYEGEYYENRRHGKGTYITPKGQRCEGTWKRGQRSGLFVTTCPQGSRTIESYKRGESHGLSVTTFSNGDRMERIHRYGVTSTHTICTHASGCTYVGDMKRNKPHGRGVHTQPDGTMYDGEWQNGMRQGYEGTLCGKTRHRYEGQWHENRSEGRGVLTMSSGIACEGTWKAGQADGRLVVFCHGIACFSCLVSEGRIVTLGALLPISLLGCDYPSTARTGDTALLRQHLAGDTEGLPRFEDHVCGNVYKPLDETLTLRAILDWASARDRVVRTDNDRSVTLCRTVCLLVVNFFVPL